MDAPGGLLCNGCSDSGVEDAGETVPLNYADESPLLYDDRLRVPIGWSGRHSTHQYCVRRSVPRSRSRRIVLAVYLLMIPMLTGTTWSTKTSKGRGGATHWRTMSRYSSVSSTHHRVFWFSIGRSDDGCTAPWHRIESTRDSLYNVVIDI